MPTFNTTLDTVITSVTSVTDFFLNLFVQIADMLFNSPFIIFIGIGIVLIGLGVACRLLGIGRGRGGRGRR